MCTEKSCQLPASSYQPRRGEEPRATTGSFDSGLAPQEQNRVLGDPTFPTLIYPSNCNIGPAGAGLETP